MKKAQSMMEYLENYGWAILIIIVVVSALYAMGVFQGTTPSSVLKPLECQKVCESKGYSYKEINMNDCYCLDKSKCYFIENRTYCEADATVIYSRM